MPVWVFRGGKLVEKTASPRKFAENANFPTPMISRMEPYESPIDGREITSWGQRERDMRDNGAVDPRDLPVRNKPDVRPEPTPEQLSFRWTDPVAE